MHPIKRQKKICSVKKQLRETRFRGKNCEDVGHLRFSTALQGSRGNDAVRKSSDIRTEI